MKISIEKIKKLREMTGISISECKKALEESGEDFEKALEILKKRGAEISEKKKERKTEEGRIGIYIHQDGKKAALVKVLCETDFVARNERFKNLCHELAMQVAAMDPKDIKELLQQEYIRDPKKKIKDLLEENIATLGENIQIKEFKRMEI